MNATSSGDVGSSVNVESHSSDVGQDSIAEAGDVNEVAGEKDNEVEMDEEFNSALNETYESYLEEGKTRGSKEDVLTEEDNVYDVSDLEVESENNEDRFRTELDDRYNDYINGAKNYSKQDKVDSEGVEDPGEEVDHIQCRNEKLEGRVHPETGVPMERREVEVDGKRIEVVVPHFDSKYDAQLPEDKLKSTDYEQFKECNAQLKEAVENDPDLKAQFDEEQLEQIENGDTPDGYTWHHDADVGKMQLVDTETHQKTGHTGGRNIWGGGTENR